MLRSWSKAKGVEKWHKGEVLLPYMQPKLKAVELTSTTDVNVTVVIGGNDADDTG